MSSASSSRFVEENYIFYFLVLSAAIWCAVVLLGVSFALMFPHLSGSIIAFSVVLASLGSVIVPLVWDGYWRFVESLRSFVRVR